MKLTPIPVFFVAFLVVMVFGWFVISSLANHSPDATEEGKGTFTPIGYVEDENVVIQEELEAYFLARAQDTCTAEGGEWRLSSHFNDGTCWITGENPFRYRNHILEGFDEYKSLKRVKEICSRNGGELIVAPSTAGAAKVVRRNGIFNFVTQTTCFIGDKEYLLKDGRLLREDELK